MAIQIDSDIPVPQPRAKNGKSEELLATLSLKVGESFFSPGKFANLAMKVGYAKTITGRVFTVRTREENGVKGARVWRLE